MRISSSFFAFANATRAFEGIGTAGLQGSNLNIVMSVLGIGVGQLGNGGSTDQGGGGGGLSGGGGSGGHGGGGGGGGGLGGSGGAGGMAGGAGTVGGPGPDGSCQKESTPPSSDADDGLEQPNPSPELSSSGGGNGDQAPDFNTMPPERVNACLGGPPTTKKPRGNWCTTLG